MFVFGHGTTRLPEAWSLRGSNPLRRLRTLVQATLHGKPHFKAPPELTLTLTMAPCVNPEFAVVAEPLGNFARDPDARAHVTRQWRNGIQEGPVARLRQIRGSAAAPTVRQPFVDRLLNAPAGPMDAGAFLHEHREAWRAHEWATLAQRRPECYAGLDGTLDRVLTLCYYKWLVKESTKLQRTLDRRKERTFLGRMDDARYRLAIMRSILHGTLFTDERIERHDRKVKTVAQLPAGVGQCPCGRGHDTVLHVSWECPLYDRERALALQHVPDRTLYPVCFQYGLLATSAVTAPAAGSGVPALGVDELFDVCTSIVDVWCARAQRYDGTRLVGDFRDPMIEEEPLPPPPPPQTPDVHDWYDAPAAAEPSLIAAALELAQVQEQAGELPAPLENNPTGPPKAAGYMLVNGHELRQRPPNDPDFPNLLYCRRCGHCTGKDSNIKKIQRVLTKSKTYQYCPARNRPESEWANRPIQMYMLRSEHQDAYRKKMTEKPINGHTFRYVWDIRDIANHFSNEEYPGLASREGAGWLQCTKCEKSWSRSDKETSKMKQKCPGSPEKTIKARTLQRKAYDEWKAKNRSNEHDIVINDKLVNWHCQRCYKIGGRDLHRWTYDAKGYPTVLTVTKFFEHKISTPCTQHTLTEEIT